MTQGKLGKSMGITASAVTNWEKGKTKPGHADLVRLADFFNVTTDELLGRKSLGNHTKVLTDPTLRELRRQLEGIVCSVQEFLERIRRLERKPYSANKKRR